MPGNTTDLAFLLEKPPGSQLLHQQWITGYKILKVCNEVLTSDFKTLFVIGLEYATFCSHLMPHLVSSKCLPLLFAKMKHFEAALTKFYN